tara:strand:+ start:2768 stop:3436 length:669 start_codon:yes stop_codon:yes gene_type:complete
MDPVTLAFLAYKGFEAGTSILNIFNARNQSALYGHRIHREKQMSKLNAAQTVNIIMDQGKSMEQSNKVLMGASGQDYDPTSGSFRVIQSDVAKKTALDVQSAILSGKYAVSKLEQLYQENKKEASAVIFGELGKIAGSTYEGYDFWNSRRTTMGTQNKYAKKHNKARNERIRKKGIIVTDHSTIWQSKVPSGTWGDNYSYKKINGVWHKKKHGYGTKWVLDN